MKYLVPYDKAFRSVAIPPDLPYRFLHLTFFLLNLTSKALEPANQAYISKEIPLLNPTSQFEDKLIYFKREIRFELIALLA